MTKENWLVLKITWLKMATTSVKNVQSKWGICANINIQYLKSANFTTIFQQVCLKFSLSSKKNEKLF